MYRSQTYVTWTRVLFLGTNLFVGLQCMVSSCISKRITFPVNFLLNFYFKTRPYGGDVFGYTGSVRPAATEMEVENSQKQDGQLILKLAFFVF